MNLLLDTHTFLWFVVANLNHHLPQATRELLEDGMNRLYLSVASPWETAIKVSIVCAEHASACESAEDRGNRRAFQECSTG